MNQNIFKPEAITFRNSRPNQPNKKCSQCREDCKQHQAVLIVQCPHFASRKSKQQDPVLGEDAKNRPLELFSFVSHPEGRPATKNAYKSNGEHP